MSSTSGEGKIVKTIKALKESIKLWNSDSMGNIDGKIKALELESESFEG